MTAAVKPIIFSGPMVRAILEGRKTQTRRIAYPIHASANWVPRWAVSAWLWYLGTSLKSASPVEYIRGSRKGIPKVGDTLWVRESFANIGLEGYEPTWFYRADGEELPPFDARCADNRWRPSIHMPRSACRLFLRVTAVRVERLQEIRAGDLLAEGMEQYVFGRGRVPKRQRPLADIRDDFEELWDSLNAKRAPWSSNPWVWVIEFERIDG